MVAAKIKPMGIANLGNRMAVNRSAVKFAAWQLDRIYGSTFQLVTFFKQNDGTGIIWTPARATFSQQLRYIKIGFMSDASFLLTSGSVRLSLT